MNGRLYRCVITDDKIELISNSVKLTVRGIKTQPTAQTAITGEKAIFKIVTTVSGATYQWQYSTNGGSTWTNSPSTGNKTNTLMVNTNVGMNGRLYRCLVTYGSTELKSKEVKLTVKGIKTQPKAITVEQGAQAIFKVVTTGSGATYQWQYSTNGGSTWKNSPSSGNKTATLTVNTNGSMNGRLYRCKVTFGDTVFLTNAVKLNVFYFDCWTSEINTSPDTQVTFSLDGVSTTDGVSFQWQYSTNNGKTWTNSPSSGNKTPVLTVNVTSSMNGRIYRCLVTIAGEVREYGPAHLFVN